LKARFLRSQLLVSRFTAIFSVLALLLLSSALLLYSACMTISSVNNDHHTALAIPNQLQKNNNKPIVKVGPDQTVNESSKVMLVGFAFDPDSNDKLTYSWMQTAGPAVILNDPNTSSPTFTAPSNIPSDTQLKFALTAKDDKGAESNNPAIITITVKHINRPPTANAGTDQTVNPGYVVTLDGTKSNDPDSGDTLTYSWIQTAGPTVTLNGANSPIATFTAPSNNISVNTDLIFRLTVKDSKNGTGAADVKVTDKYIPPPNQPPTANAGVDQTVNAGDNVHLDGTKSKDPDGTIASYSWKQIGGAAVVLNGANTAAPTFTAPSNISSSVVLVFGLTVTDDKNATGISTAKITVNPVNHPPVANAGTDQTVNAGYIVSLDGSKSKDPDNDPLTYTWKQVGGQSVTLNGADTSIATFTAPKDISSDTDLTFELTVTDSKNATNTATVKVTDKYIPPPNQPPTANAGTDQTVNTDDTVTLDGSGSTDPDGNITSYSWTQTDGPVITLSDASVASPTFTAPSVSSDTELKFSLTVKDDKDAASNNPATVTVTVKAAAPSGNMTAAEGGGNMTGGNMTAAEGGGNMTGGNMTGGNMTAAEGGGNMTGGNMTGGNMTAAEGGGNMTGGNMTSTTAPLPSSDVIALNDKALALYNQGNYAEAITYYDKALAIDPNNEVALYGKGSALNYKGNYAEAILYFDKALAIDPNDKEALNNKGYSLFSQGNYAEAITYYDKALAIDPNFIIALIGKGNALYGQGKYAEAITYYDKALAIDPNNKDYLQWKQNALSKMSGAGGSNMTSYGGSNMTSYGGSNMTAAEPSYGGSNMTSVAPSSSMTPVAPRPLSAVSALDKNGEYLAVLGKHSQAIEYFEKALAIDPNDKRTLSDIGVVYSIQGNYIQAIEYFDKALAIDPNYNTAVLGKVVSLSKMGHRHK
jgi:tetratricopeptide (TPR) repeat protein